MDKLTRKCLELIARVVVMFIREDKVVPRELYKLDKIAKGQWEEVE